MTKTETTTAPLSLNDKVELAPEYQGNSALAGVFTVVRMPTGRSKSYGVQHSITGAVFQATRRAFVKLDMADIPADLPVLPVALHPGMVVSVSGAGWKHPIDSKYVITRCKSDGNYEIAKLGGDNGNVFPKVPRSYLTVASI